MESLRISDASIAASGFHRRAKHQQFRPAPKSLKRRSCVIRGAQVCSIQDAGLWQRVREAWTVLVGSSRTSSRRRMKQRFSRILITDRGFDAERLTKLYDLAKAAISQHVVLEESNLQQEMARVEHLGRLQFQFNVRRIRSSAQDEPWAQPSIIEYEPSVPGSEDDS